MAVVGKTYAQIALRVSEEIRDRIKEVAAINRRSMNSEIVVLLEKALENEKGGAVS